MPLKCSRKLKRTALYCLISGTLGGLLAVALTRGPSVEPRSLAQEPAVAPAPSPQFTVPAPPSICAWFCPARAVPVPILATPVPGPLDGVEYTSEERVNIWVYEQVNRSVVNITTKGYQGERVLLFEVPSEGEGSGMVLDRQGHILTNYHVVEGLARSR